MHPSVLATGHLNPKITWEFHHPIRWRGQEALIVSRHPLQGTLCFAIFVFR